MGTLQRLGPRESSCKSIFRRLTVGRAIGLRIQQFEMTFPRLLHLLAHHPDFEMTHTSLVEMSRSANFFRTRSISTRLHYNRYIKFYTLTVATADNVSLIFHLAEKLKTIQDAESGQYSEACVSSLPRMDYLLFVPSAYMP